MQKVFTIIFTIALLNACSNDASNTNIEPLVPFYSHGKWGYADTNRVIRITPDYQEANFFINGKALVNKNGKYYFINKTGKKISKKYNNIEIINEKYSLIGNNNSKSIIDCNFKIIEGPVYFATKLNKKAIAYINGSSLVIINDDLSIHTPYLSFVNKNDTAIMLRSDEKLLTLSFGKYTLLFNENGKFIGKSTDYYFCQNNLILFKNTKRQMGVLDIKGDTIIPFGFYEGLDRIGLFFKVSEKGFDKIFDATSNKYLPLNHKKVDLSGYPFFYVKNQNKWGLVDKYDELVIPYRYDSIHICNDSFAWVKDAAVWILYNYRLRKKVSDKKFETVKCNFRQSNFEIITINSLYGLIDTQTNFLIEPICSDIQYCNDEYFLIQKAGKKQIFNARNNSTNTVDSNIISLEYGNGLGIAQLKSPPYNKEVLVNSMGVKISNYYLKIIHPRHYESLGKTVPQGLLLAIRTDNAKLILINKRGQEFADFKIKL